jgi:basic amino acid/polyamine antiporter, APA family
LLKNFSYSHIWYKNRILGAMRKSNLSSTVFQMKRATLKRVLGVFDLFAIGYGDLGSSIYYALGVTALFALGATPIALALAGVVFICTALTYAEMTSTIHESGGSASFARHAFNDLISFIAGWGLLLDYIVTIAISAFAVGPYLAYFFADLHKTPVQLVFTSALIIILFAMNVIGVKQSTRISLILTTITVLVQAIIIAIGLSTLLDLDYVVDHIRIGIPNVNWSPTWGEFFKGVAMAMVAYTGIESIAQLAAEAQRPARTVPRAVVMTMVVLILIYLGISVVALSAITPQELGTKYILNPVAAIVDALPFGSKILSPLIAIIAAIVLGVAANAGLMGASRLSFNMGEYYQLPRIFYVIHPRFRTPIVSLAFFALIAALVVLASRGSMDFLADLYNFGAMLAFLSAHLSLICLRIKKPNLKRPFRAPLNIPFGKHSIPLTAIIGAISTLSVWFLVVITKPQGRYLGFAWMTFGLIMYLSYRKKRKLEATGRVSIEQIRVPGYQPMKVERILVPTRGGMQTETVQMACEIAKLHRAKVTALQVIEIPASLPLDIQIPHRMILAEAVLKRAEAIAREIGVEIELRIIRSRSLPETILEVASKGKFDLLVLGVLKTNQDPKTKGVGPIADKILKKSPCRVWICASDTNGHSQSTLLT